MVGMGNFFKVCWHSWQRVANPLFLWRPSYIAYPPFLKCCPPTHPQHLCHLQSPPPLFFLLPCFFSWMGDHTTHHIWCAILLNGNIDPHVSSLGSLVPEGPWYVFSAIRHQIYWGLTHTIKVKYICYHTHTNFQTHTALSGASRLTHPYKYIFTSPVICSQ